jgi:hypothetical protein
MRSAVILNINNKIVHRFWDSVRNFERTDGTVLHKLNANRAKILKESVLPLPERVPGQLRQKASGQCCGPIAAPSLCLSQPATAKIKLGIQKASGHFCGLTSTPSLSL